MMAIGRMNWSPMGRSQLIMLVLLTTPYTVPAARTYPTF